MRQLTLMILLANLLTGCGDGGSGHADDPTVLSHEFETVSVDVGEEISWWCQSWRLDNDEPLYVNTVRSNNDGFWHHSNWFFVPESFYQGEGDTWPCDERGFDEVAAGVAGGVLFAQSTQSTSDVQAFDDGLAFRIPPRSQVVGNIHLLNLGDAPIESAIRFEIETLPEDEVETVLRPMAFFNRAIELPANQESTQTMECDFGEPMDFNIHFVLPHYHELGVGIAIERVGGDRDGEPVLAFNPVVGEPWGQALVPPEPMAGATGLRFTCTFENFRDRDIGWGIGEEEMCVFLSYTDSAFTHGGFANAGTNEEVAVEGGVSINEAPCQLDSF
jgi:hypothetical protein